MNIDIHKQYNKILLDRRTAMKNLMKEYDENIYYPALKKLREECEKIGHVKGDFHDNGLGWTWWYCSNCGASFDEQRYGE